MLTKNHKKLISRCEAILNACKTINEISEPLNQVIKNPHNEQRFICNYLKPLREQLESLSRALAQASIAYHYHRTKNPLNDKGL
jgi:hypothetical protein